MDQLRKALQGALPPAAPRPDDPAAASPPLRAADPDPSSPTGSPTLPDPLAGEWGALLRDLGVEIPRGPTLGQLTQRSDAKSRELLAVGRRREAEALKRAKESYLRERERAAWALVKARFEALALPEKAYRALKQEGADAERVLLRVSGKRGEALRGAGASRVRDALLEG